MMSERQSTRIEQQRTLLCAAAVRALTGDGRLHYRSGRLFRGHAALPAHALTVQDASSAKRAVLRGDADALAQLVAGIVEVDTETLGLEPL